MGNVSPKFSIVTAAFNRAHSLPKSVESILSQTYKDFELLIVDDGSSDGTGGYIKSLVDPRIHYVRLPENQGASTARNRGIDEARGEYVLVWDSDDELYPHALLTLKEAFEAHPDAGIVSAPAVPLKKGAREPYTERDEGYVALPQILAKYLPNNEKVRAARRELHQEARYLSRNLDFMVNAYLARQAPWYHLKEPLGVLHIDNPDSLTRGRKKRLASRAIERAEHLAQFIDDFGAVLKKTSPKRLAAHAYGAALGFYLARDPERAMRMAGLAAGNAPSSLKYLLLWVAVRLPFLRPVLSKFY